MKRFLKNIAIFFLLALIVGEVVIRITHEVSDIPQRKIDEYGIQKYYPNQDGYWKGGNHKWNVNSMGWPGELPENFDNLIVVIGDSFIENFMNPNECHQAFLLKKNMPNYNFMEAGRSGVSFIEAMEISKQFDSLKPIQNLIYVHDSDFYESLYNVQPLFDITQFDAQSKKIVYGKMKSPLLKKILYNWKLLYYFYNRFPPSKIGKKSKDNTPENELKTESLEENTEEIHHKKDVLKLIDYSSKNYSIKNKTLVFFPNCGSSIMNLCKDAGFKTIKLNSSNDKKWTFDYDKHWTCYGHTKAAEQISTTLKTNFKY